MKHCIEIEDANATIRLSGKISYNESQSFLDFGALVKNGLRQLEVNLSDVSFIDSVGVGMLIILAEHAKIHGCKMRISGVSGQVERVFKAAELLSIIEWDREAFAIETA